MLWDQQIGSRLKITSSERATDWSRRTIVTSVVDVTQWEDVSTFSPVPLLVEKGQGKLGGVWRGRVRRGGHTVRMDLRPNWLGIA